MRSISSVMRGTCAVTLAVCATIPATAHHTFVKKYDSAKKITLSGSVENVRFSNPHIFFTLETAKGSWTIETEGVAVANAKGLTAARLTDGAKATVTGWPARDGSAALGLATIAFPGGPTVSMRGTAR